MRHLLNVSQEAMEELAQNPADSTGTMFLVGILMGIGCIVLGIILLTGSKEFLQNNAFFNGGRHRKGGALIVYRFIGGQMLTLGLLLILCIIGFSQGIAWLALSSLVLLIVLPFLCSSYMKRSKRFK